MKRLHDIVSTLCVLFLFSCGQQYEPELIAIDSMADASPDSAAVLLSKFDTLNVSEGNRMYYYLLRAKVSDHLDQLDATAEEAEQLVTYFEDDGDEYLLPIAYYYGGRICAEADNVPQALDYFHKAEILLTDDHSLPMPKGDRDKSLLSKVYSQMGYLFVYRNMYEEARRCSQKSYELDKAIRDTVGMIFNLRDIGSSYDLNKEIKESLPYYKKARALAISCHDEVMRHDLEVSLTHAYHKTGQTDSAKNYAKRIMSEITPIDSSAIFSIVSALYYDTNKTDSAEVLLNNLLTCGTKFAQCYAHEKLALLCMKKNHINDAILHHKQYRALRDTIDKEYSTSAIAQANSAYNYQSKEKENYQLKLANVQVKLILFCIIACVIIIALISFFSFNRYRYQQAEKLKELERIKNDLFQQSEEFRQQSRQRIAELEVQLQDAGTANDDLRQQLENEKGKLEASLEMAKVKERESKHSLCIIKDSNVYCRILRLTNEGSPQTITDEDWQELSSIINQEYKGFTQRLFELCGKMSELEYRVCLLIKADTDLNKVAEILIKAQPTISTTRSRLYQKAFGKKGSAKDWDAVIKAL